jgi:type I restriction enzyme R subunit
MQQALDYAEALDAPFVFSSNGDGFVFHDRTGTGAQVETHLGLDQFPSPAELWQRYCLWKGLTRPPSACPGRSVPVLRRRQRQAPRYYQRTPSTARWRPSRAAAAACCW